MEPITEINRIKKLVKINNLLTLTEDKVLDMLKISGALNEGHFQLLSGLHADIFLKFRLIVERSGNGFLSYISHELAERFRDIKIDVILGSTKAGGLLIDNLIGEFKNSKIAFVEVNGEGWPTFTLKKGYSINPNDKVLIINDLNTTGQGLKRLVQVVKNNKGIINGIALFATRNRNILNQEFQNVTSNIETLIDLNVKDIKPINCPLCKARVPLEFSIDHC